MIASTQMDTEHSVGLHLDFISNSCSLPAWLSETLAHAVIWFN
jgi:hypothetical protein